MSRIQLALNVPDLDAAVNFYSKLFDAQPSKRHPGYANFAISQPPLKLVLFENIHAPSSINHLGVEVDSAEEVQAATHRFATEGLVTDLKESTDCCYALQDKVWVTGPDEARWEFYVVHADTDGSVPDGCTTNTADRSGLSPDLCCT